MNTVGNVTFKLNSSEQLNSPESRISQQAIASERNKKIQSTALAALKAIGFVIAVVGGASAVAMLMLYGGTIGLVTGTVLLGIAKTAPLLYLIYLAMNDRIAPNN